MPVHLTKQIRLVFLLEKALTPVRSSNLFLLWHIFFFFIIIMVELKFTVYLRLLIPTFLPVGSQLDMCCMCMIYFLFLLYKITLIFINN